MEESRDRISFSHIFDGVLKVLNFERGLLLTIRELFLRPGDMIRAYFDGDRKKYTHPVQFSVMLVGISTFLTKIIFAKFLSPSWQNDLYNTGYEVGSGGGETPPEAIETINTLTEGLFQYMNVFTLLFIPITAILTYLFYRKAKLYYTEHLVLNAYITGAVSLLSIALVPLYFVSFSTAATLSMIINLAYGIWAYMDIFKEKNVVGALKAGLINVLSFVLIMFLVAVFGVVVAVVMLRDTL